MVYWTEDEWKEDSQVVFSIVNAVQMAIQNPEELLCLNRKHIESQQV